MRDTHRLRGHVEDIEDLLYPSNGWKQKNATHEAICGYLKWLWDFVN